MTLYRYEAIDKTGKVLRGAMNAASEQAVGQRLASMGYSLKAVMPADAYKQVSAKQIPKQAAASKAAAPGFPVTVQPVVSLGALVRFYRQLATLVRSGMPIYQSLDELQGTISKKKLRLACAEMKERVQRGESLSSAMATYPLLFPTHTVGIIWGGELGGYLDMALDEAASEIEKEYKENRFASIGWLLTYGTIASIILLLPVFDLRSFLIRGLTKGGQMAGATPGEGDLIPMEATYQHFASGMLQAYLSSFLHICIPIFIGWLVLHYTWKYVKRIPSIRRVLDAMLLRVPAWGRLHMSRARARFFRSLNRLYQSGVAPAQAWAAASMSVRNSDIALRLRAKEQVMRSQGGTLQQAFAESGVFTTDDVGMVASGERAGAVPETLGRLADYQADAADSARGTGRMIGVHGLILFIIITSGYFMIMVEKGYFDFVFDATKLLGLE